MYPIIPRLWIGLKLKQGIIIFRSGSWREALNRFFHILRSVKGIMGLFSVMARIQRDIRQLLVLLLQWNWEFCDWFVFAKLSQSYWDKRQRHSQSIASLQCCEHGWLYGWNLVYDDHFWCTKWLVHWRQLHCKQYVFCGTN